MRDRKKRNIIIGALCCLLIFMGIGYAILSQTLNISGIANMQGNWSVKITNMELLDKNKTGRAEEVSHSFTDTTATFEANLYMPGDSIEYRVTVENQGNIDAVLKSITPTTTNRSEGIKFSHSEIDNTVLTAGKTITFTMKVEFLEDATSIPKVDKLTYNLELIYIQYDGKSEYTPAVETTEDSCFWISDDGTLLSYDRSCGTDNVVIPAKVNGIPIKRVLPIITTDIKASLAYNDNGEALVFKSQDDINEYLETLKNEMSDENINEIKKISYIYNDVSYNNLNLHSFKDFLTKETYADFSNKAKYTKDDDGTIHIDYSKDDYNVVKYYTNNIVACTTTEVCNLVREKHNVDSDSCISEDVKIVSDTYYTDAKLGTIGTLDDYNYVYFMPLIEASDRIAKIDFSNAIYIENLFEFSNADTIILPPNINTLSLDTDAKRVIMPENSITKSIHRITNPTYVKISPSVVSIGGEAFESINSTKDKLQNIEFYKNSNLRAIYSYDGSSSCYGAFEQNELTSITIPKSVEYIGTSAFEKNQLTSVIFESGSKLKYIDNDAFADNQLTSINIPSTVEAIYYRAFKNNKLTTLKFENGSKLKYLNGFYNNQLTDINIPSTVETIGENAFAGNKLTNIVIPSLVETIDQYAFENNKLTTVKFEEGSKLKTIGNSAFSTNQLTNTGLGKLPSSLTSLSTSAFSGNSNLTQITLTSPSNVKKSKYDSYVWSDGDKINVGSDKDVKYATIVYER